MEYMEKENSHQRHILQTLKVVFRASEVPLEKNLKSGPLRMHFQDSGAKVRVFEQNTDIIKFWLFFQ